MVLEYFASLTLSDRLVDQPVSAGQPLSFILDDE
jgi:hypothetical protein